ncbi:helix-turn-helix domain-containing protein [Streptomyces sp. NPDC102409]|uniref:helix-turn-helix domain-containing protein n=1 Tax=Streptomyces sp. NPDC102409 TaxID=3366172 RepID=UPI00381CDC9F
MGRPERPVAGPPHLESLALYLRTYRAVAGVTYEEMAQHVGASPATLKRTAAGATVPRWDRVAEFQSAIRQINDVALYKVEETIPSHPDSHRVREALHSLWINARREERGTLDVMRVVPETVGNPAELRYALWALYENAGAPPLRTVQARGGELLLPLSSLTRIVNQKTIPADDQQLVAFLNGLGLRRTSEMWNGRWIEARARVTSLKGTPNPYLDIDLLHDREQDVPPFSRLSRARLKRQFRVGVTRTG